MLTLRTSLYEVLLLRASCLLAFKGVFKISKLVARLKFESTEHELSLADIMWMEQGLRITFRIMKTDQRGQGQVVLLYRGGEKDSNWI